MGELTEFGSTKYLLLLALLLGTRALDFLSTWIATPNLVLEGNPVARKLGWRWGIPVNIVVCVALAFWIVPATILITTSALVAARNFQFAWLARSFGEHNYREWHTARLRETRPTLVTFCVLAHVSLFGAVGAALVYFGGPSKPGGTAELMTVTQAIGVGVIAYAAAVAVFTLMNLWKLYRGSSSSKLEV
ncbi:MAG: hypothetical protein NZ739_08515 [Verrucomicrobiae bacterium]|nr:hypothetical protein [Verrucomicrobiae bacterium]MDW7981163.1 hypothetical protein [Verrucomicrobiales bacterium]